MSDEKRPDARDPAAEFYDRSRLPPFAPPSQAFPIAWGINAVSLGAGMLRALSMKSRSSARTDFIRWQAVAWVLFASFNAAYFKLRSPINAAAITLAYDVATVASLRAAVRSKDKVLIASLATTLAWLCLATPLAAAQAALNRDRFYNVGPFVK